MVFVLIGMQPTIQKGARWLSRLLEMATDKKERLAPSDKEVHAAIFTGNHSTQDLNDFEIIVIQHLSRRGKKAVSARQINENLLFGDTVFKKTLWSLHRRGLISVRMSKLLGPRFILSESGRKYALKQGYIVQFQQKKEVGQKKAVSFWLFALDE